MSRRQDKPLPAPPPQRTLPRRPDRPRPAPDPRRPGCPPPLRGPAPRAPRPARGLGSRRDDQLPARRPARLGPLPETGPQRPLPAERRPQRPLPAERAHRRAPPGDIITTGRTAPRPAPMVSCPLMSMMSCLPDSSPLPRRWPPRPAGSHKLQGSVSDSSCPERGPRGAAERGGDEYQVPSSHPATAPHSQQPPLGLSAQDPGRGLENGHGVHTSPELSTEGRKHKAFEHGKPYLPCTTFTLHCCPVCICI
ncbi:hypothetical protein AAFF_G00237700 [Aldrovandia affinis]|uniref:Uncharacterized protein n=1 Tax=Aldrovandia affinis TaxID=143900 RepID=A0AAD7RE59_9TELE|nr:hypothetical protein AAFF_G00237700 [Aldrovandia affinis]